MSTPALKRFGSVRLFLLAAVLLVSAVAAVIFLPAGIFRLAGMVLLALPVALILFDRPAWIFYIVIFLTMSNAFVLTGLPLMRLSTVFLVVAFTVAVINGRQVVIHDRVFFTLSAVFLILAFQSSAFAVDIRLAFDRMGFFMKLLLRIFMAVQFARSREELLRFLLIVCAATMFNAFMPLVLPPPAAQADLSLLWAEGIYRYEGYLRDPNMFAFGIIFAIPLLMFLFYRFRRPWFARPMILALIGGSVFVLFLSFSRGGFVSLAVMLLALLFVERRNKAVVISGIVMIVAAATAAPAMYWERLQTLFDTSRGITSDFSVLSRIETMRVAWILGVKNPIFGVGPGNYLFHASRYIPYGNYVHNSVLQVLSEMGFTGLAAFAAVIVYSVRSSLRLMSLRSDPEASHLGRMLFVQFAALLTASMFIPVAFYLEFWLALILPTIAWYAYRAVPSGRSGLSVESLSEEPL